MNFRATNVDKVSKSKKERYLQIVVFADTHVLVTSYPVPIGAIDFVSTASLAFRLLAIHNVEMEQRMQLRILQLSPDLSTKHIHLLLRITQLTRK